MADNIRNLQKFPQTVSACLRLFSCLESKLLLFKTVNFPQVCFNTLLDGREIYKDGVRLPIPQAVSPEGL